MLSVIGISFVCAEVILIPQVFEAVCEVGRLVVCEDISPGEQRADRRIHARFIKTGDTCCGCG